MYVIVELNSNQSILHDPTMICGYKCIIITHSLYVWKYIPLYYLYHVYIQCWRAGARSQAFLERAGARSSKKNIGSRSLRAVITIYRELETLKKKTKNGSHGQEPGTRRPGHFRRIQSRSNKFINGSQDPGAGGKRGQISYTVYITAGISGGLSFFILNFKQKIYDNFNVDQNLL